MRIGINVPNELIKRLEPYKDITNVSKICRDAIKDWVETYERAKDRVSKDEIKDVAQRLHNEIKSCEYEVDWEVLGQEDAKMWAQMATLENFEHLFHNLRQAKRNKLTPGPFLGPHLEGVKLYIDRQVEHEKWFERQFDIDNDEGPNHYVLAQERYNKGWVAYLTSVWDMAKRGTDIEDKY
ncbi:hypothetical protein ACFLW1_00555 [Chloroflexota bacterium]